MNVSLPVWRLLNDVHRSTTSTAADIIVRRCGVDFPVLDKMTTDHDNRPAYVAYANFDNRYRAPRPVCAADLKNVALRLTPAGVSWTVATIENQAVQCLADQSPDLHDGFHGPTLHLSTLLGKVPDLHDQGLRFLTRQKIVRVRSTIGDGWTLSGDDITPEVLNECRQITVTLTPRGRWLSARPPATTDDPGEPTDVRRHQGHIRLA